MAAVVEDRAFLDAAIRLCRPVHPVLFAADTRRMATSGGFVDIAQIGTRPEHSCRVAPAEGLCPGVGPSLRGRGHQPSSHRLRRGRRTDFQSCSTWVGLGPWQQSQHQTVEECLPSVQIGRQPTLTRSLCLLTRLAGKVRSAELWYPELMRPAGKSGCSQPLQTPPVPTNDRQEPTSSMNGCLGNSPHGRMQLVCRLRDRPSVTFAGRRGPTSNSGIEPALPRLPPAAYRPSGHQRESA